ncbi:MAG: AEC family transporter, partial [Hyphomicrobium sp.]
IVVPVFICVAIGFAWVRLNRRFDVEFVTILITNIGAPCLVFHTLANLDIEPSAFGRMVGAAAAMIAVCTVVSVCVLTALRLPRQAYLSALVFANTGNMGLSLSYLAFGDVGLGLAIGVFAVYSVTMFTLGPALASGAASWRTVARVPILYAVPPALGFMLTNAPLPQWIDATTALLGDITIPMMLIALGVSLSRLKVTSLRRSFGLALLRLVMGFSVALGIALAFDLNPIARGVLVVQGSMPSAVFNDLVAQRYKTMPEEVAGIVVISTAIAFVLLPFLLWFVLS